MKIILCLILFGLIYSIEAQPKCTFDFDSNQNYYCPLTGGNIEDNYEGEIEGTHFKGMFPPF